MHRTSLILIVTGWIGLLIVGLVFIDPVYEALEPIIPHGLRRSGTATHVPHKPGEASTATNAAGTNATGAPAFLSRLFQPIRTGHLLVAAPWAPLRESPARRGRELGAAFHGELLPLLSTNIISNHYRTLAGTVPAFVPADSVEPVRDKRPRTGLVAAGKLPGGTEPAAVARESWRALARGDREGLAGRVLDRLTVHLVLAEERITLEPDDLRFLPDGEILGGSRYDYPVRLGTLFALARRIPAPPEAVRTNEPWPAMGPLRLVIVRRGSRYFLSALFLTENPRPD